MKNRGDVPFDTRFFTRKAKPGKEKSVEEKFSFIHENNFWGGNNSVSGEGSDSAQTAAIRSALPKIFSAYNINSLLDIPCGDFNWMKTMDLSMLEYTGADIVREIVDKNNCLFVSSNKKFLKLNLIQDALPQVDLVFCRDCLVHLSFADIHSSLKNIYRSGAKYLLTTTFTGCKVNEDIVSGDWRILNFMKYPFNFPEPLVLLNENCTEGNGTFADKSLGLWVVSELPIKHKTQTPA
ncbi:MAG: class I SAM-dependent methyltransferase [Ignavibacteriales bacterium]|nr:class I SAM-dependent methyltransferase [Ignavibacteriales bacterium]